jgi:hypothetical protein
MAVELVVAPEAELDITEVYAVFHTSRTLRNGDCASPEAPTSVVGRPEGSGMVWENGGPDSRAGTFEQ